MSTKVPQKEPMAQARNNGKQPAAKSTKQSSSHRPSKVSKKPVQSQRANLIPKIPHRSKLPESLRSLDSEIVSSGQSAKIIRISVSFRAHCNEAVFQAHRLDCITKDHLDADATRCTCSRVEYLQLRVIEALEGGGITIANDDEEEQKDSWTLSILNTAFNAKKAGGSPILLMTLTTPHVYFEAATLRHVGQVLKMLNDWPEITVSDRPSLEIFVGVLDHRAKHYAAFEVQHMKRLVFGITLFEEVLLSVLDDDFEGDPSALHAQHTSQEISDQLHSVTEMSEMAGILNNHILDLSDVIAESRSLVSFQKHQGTLNAERIIMFTRLCAGLIDWARSDADDWDTLRRIAGTGVYCRLPLLLSLLNIKTDIVEYYSVRVGDTKASIPGASMAEEEVEALLDQVATADEVYGKSVHSENGKQTIWYDIRCKGFPRNMGGELRDVVAREYYAKEVRAFERRRLQGRQRSRA